MVIYDAEHIVQWLKHYSLMDPVTHTYIRPGFAADILCPTSTATAETHVFLARAGYLDGNGGKVFDLILQL